MWNALIDAGEPGLEVLHAYTVKEQLRAPCCAADDRGPRAHLGPALEVLAAADCGKQERRPHTRIGEGRGAVRTVDKRPQFRYRPGFCPKSTRHRL